MPITPPCVTQIKQNFTKFIVSKTKKKKVETNE